MDAAAGRAARRARRPRGLVGQAVDDDRRGLGRPRRAPSTCRRASSTASARPACSTTSASSRSRTRSWPSRATSPTSEWRVVDRASQDRPGRARAGRRPARRGDDRAPPPRVVRRPRLSPRADRRARSRSARGSCRSSTPTRRWSRGGPYRAAISHEAAHRRAPPPGRRPVRPGPRGGVRRAVLDRAAVGPRRPRGQRATTARDDPDPSGVPTPVGTTRGSRGATRRTGSAAPAPTADAHDRGDPRLRARSAAPRGLIRIAASGERPSGGRAPVGHDGRVDGVRSIRDVALLFARPQPADVRLRVPGRRPRPVPRRRSASPAPPIGLLLGLTLAR